MVHCTSGVASAGNLCPADGVCLDADFRAREELGMDHTADQPLREQTRALRLKAPPDGVSMVTEQIQVVSMRLALVCACTKTALICKKEDVHISGLPMRQLQTRAITGNLMAQ